MGRSNLTAGMIILTLSLAEAGALEATVDIVLVRPARPANVAAACRAMKNMGLSRLVLVQPPAGLEEPEARALAYGAWDLLDAAVPADDLADAVAGASLVVGTTGKTAEGTWTPRQLATDGMEAARGGRMAVVFGPEASGLRHDELSRCHRLVHIPTHTAHSSLNLAQAVLIVAYELFLAAPPPPAPDEPRAAAGELEMLLDDLRTALLAIGFLNPQNPEAVLTEFRRMWARGGLTPRELTLLRGLARQIRWAGSRGSR
jgi:TrmH family RNA methyltransferase